MTNEGPRTDLDGTTSGDSNEPSDAVFAVAVRSVDERAPDATRVNSDARTFAALSEAQRAMGEATDLHDAVVAAADGVLSLLSNATHVTVAMGEEESASATSTYTPVVTRVRTRDGSSADSDVAVPVTRSVVRKVVEERAAVLATDAQAELPATESLLGASIRSTLAVPLWRGQQILGVLQVDNRENKGVFTARDVELALVVAYHASLAVANARLVRKLKQAEERLSRENQYLKGREEKRRAGGQARIEILGKSAAMAALLANVDKIVDTRVAVLIEGETGTGKELVASAIHYRSKRRDRLFVAQNCAAGPEQLLESELFGHKRGAFTGATEDKKGLFEVADGGTLFLDEVTEMPLSTQAKLLRALQEGTIRPIGSTQERRVDVRIVAATNRNVEGEVRAGRFREDLYYRLQGFPIRVPALRERREDIELLARHFMDRACAELGKSVAGFAQGTLELLKAHEFPGNVRELQNEVQRLVIHTPEGAFIQPEALSSAVRSPGTALDRARPPKGTLKEMMDHVERWLVLEALREHGDNKTATAKSLGISREGLHKKLRALGID